MTETSELVPLSDLLLALIVVTLAIALCAGLAYIIKNRFNLSKIRKAMHPTARLAVLETIPVDQKRKLILIRKDGTEHLIMTGGPSDLIVETGGSAQSNQPSMGQMSHDIEGDRTIVASNDEYLEQNSTFEQQSYGQDQSQPLNQTTSQSNTQTNIQDNANGAEKALEMLLKEEAEMNEDTVATAVGMLTSEEEVGNFFDKARNRVFSNGQNSAERDDTDDFTSVLRAQQTNQLPGQQPAQRSVQQPPQRSGQQPTSRATPSSQLTQEQETYIQRRKKLAAREAQLKAIQPIPDTAEERLKRIKSLIGQNKQS